MVKRPIAKLTLILILGGPTLLHAQIKNYTQEAQLRTDPVLGNIQGVHRFGRSMKTDPDEGTGYSYEVLPTAHASVAPIYVQGSAVPPNAGNNMSGMSSDQRQILAKAESAKQQLAKLNALSEADRPGDYYSQLGQITRDISAARAIELEFGFSATSAYGYHGPPMHYGSAHYPPAYYPGNGAPFDATAGLRNYATPQGAPGNLNYDFYGAPGAYGAQSAIALNGGGFSAFAGSFQRGATFNAAAAAAGLDDIYHQPLVHIKLRVVEVVRNDDLRASSVLEYVSSSLATSTLTTGAPLNNNPAQQNVRSLTRFPVDGLITGADAGAGLLLNITGEHINSAVSLLARDFNADIVTAPSVVTLNGQNVEFVSGQKIPFRLGQNVTTGANARVQEFFYKNVGSYVSVTPKIVNWGFHGEGQGEAVVTANDVLHWNLLIEWISDTDHGVLSNSDADVALKEAISPYLYNQIAVPFSIKARILHKLKDLSRERLIQLGMLPEVQEFLDCDALGCRNWKPNDCTIDLALVVRLSDRGSEDIKVNAADEEAETTANFENNVRAIANIIQLKSGDGIVMAGLIGEREVQSADKIPVLGDIPILGAAFRSKVALREKTEVLIFLEAEVLDPRPEVARCQTANDYLLSQPYLNESLLDNPLECGFCRNGFGQYLPPACPREQAFWDHFYRSLRRMSTNTNDLLR